MAYETGSSSGPNDLLDKLRAFLLANGWTINSFTALGSGYRLHVSKGSVFVNFRSYVAEVISAANFINGSTTTNAHYGIAGYPSDGYNGSLGWNLQPGYPNYSSACQGGCMPGLTSAIPTYHFFAYPDSDEIYVVVEFVTNRFQMMSFGTILKYNAAAVGGRWMSMPGRDRDLATNVQSSGGIDYSGAGSLIPFRSADYNDSMSSASSLIRVNIDSHDGWAFEARSSAVSFSSIGCASQGVWDADLVAGTVSPYNWQTQMVPHALLISRDSAIAYSPFGELRNFRRLDITNYLPAEEFSLGPDTWKTFPLFQKGGYSFTRGFALKKVS